MIDTKKNTTLGLLRHVSLVKDQAKSKLIQDMTPNIITSKILHMTKKTQKTKKNNKTDSIQLIKKMISGQSSHMYRVYGMKLLMNI